MKRPGFILTSACAFLLTGATLNHLGWFSARAAQRADAAAQSHDALDAAASRWRQNQPDHWRSCLLQR